MSKALVRSGHQVTVVCGSYSRATTGLTESFKGGTRRGNVDGIDIIELDLKYENSQNFLKRSFIFLRFALRSVGLALTEDYDLIFCTSTPLTAGIPGIVARHFRRKKFVFEVRDLWPELPRAMGVIKNPIILGLMSILEWASYKSATKLIGLAPGMVDGIKKRGIIESKIAMIPNGCDLELFNAYEKSARPTAVDDDDLLLIYAGTFGLANGLGSLLDVAAQLKKIGEEKIKFLLVGDGMERQMLVDRVRREDLTNVLFQEPVSKSKVVGLMKASDIGIQCLANVPAFYNGTSPNKFFDYISCSLPVIVNYPGWLTNLVVERQCGFSVSPNNPVEFAELLKSIQKNRDQLIPMGANANQMAKDKFNRAILSRHFVNWLEK